MKIWITPNVNCYVSVYRSVHNDEPPFSLTIYLPSETARSTYQQLWCAATEEDYNTHVENPPIKPAQYITMREWSAFCNGFLSAQDIIVKHVREYRRQQLPERIYVFVTHPNGIPDLHYHLRDVCAETQIYPAVDNHSPLWMSRKFTGNLMMLWDRVRNH